MRRLRVLLFAVAIAIGVPVALLAWRALDGLAVERAVQHQTVAERAFDEMERALTTFLETEERRPFEHYAPRMPDGRPSPLAEPSSWPFVVGAFQVEPDGGLTLPMEASGFHAANHDTVRRLVSAAFESSDAGTGAKGEVASPQAPGTTRAVAGRLKTRRDAAGKDLEQSDETVFDMLQSLNRAAGDRRRKVAEAKKQSYGDYASPGAESSVGREAEAFLEADDAEIRELEQNQLRSLGYALEGGASPVQAQARAEPQRPAAPETQPAQQTAPITEALLEPMMGREAGADHLLLYRTLLRNRQGYRQGLVIDRAALGVWLEREIVSALGGAVSLSFEVSPTVADGEGDIFLHRFAEPFDAMSARMQLAGLAGSSGPGTVHALVGLLVIVGVAGLFAIYRMVSVVVHFAERRNNFVAAVTHELKTPLTAIRMYAEMLRDGMVRDDAKRDEYYGTITDESERLSRLIDNVLEFSRLERDTREMDWVVGSLAPVLEDVAERLAAHAARQGFRIETDVEPGLPAIRFDRDALVQVLFNLVDNAMKYARSADERRIVLEARRDGGAVAVAVRDFGPGVPGSHLSKIFEPFYRGEDELTRTTKGTGIGLALVKDLAERMGAAVSGGNAQDGGFRVELSFAAPA